MAAAPEIPREGAFEADCKLPRSDGFKYERHRPEATPLFEAVQSHWRTFLGELSSDGDDERLPGFVTAKVEAYLRCGILAHGFVLARCGDCGYARPVAWSCQRRGFCPSCIGRGMSDFAARAVRRVFPQVPIRQWVLTVPHPLRARLAFDPALVTVVLDELALGWWLGSAAQDQQRRRCCLRRRHQPTIPG